MDRRTFLAAAGAGLLAAPLIGEAQQGGKIWKIGVLTNGPLTDPGVVRSWETFQRALQERGYVEERNVVFERRFAEGKDERYPALAAELVRLKVDLLVTWNGPALTAAKGATTTIPIVTAGTDPVGRGLVDSLARPGGNITGVATYGLDLAGKRLELLKTAVPKAARVVLITNSGGWDQARLTALRKETDARAHALGMVLIRVQIDARPDFGSATAAIVRERPDGLLVSTTPINFELRREIAEFAAKQRLPSIGSRREEALAGILMTYAPSPDDNIRGVAVFVDKILKGAKPANLPIEQPTKFELIINLKTAKELGLTTVQSLLARADEVIQ
jgi:putative ABC transport system substrate-binding protein